MRIECPNCRGVSTISGDLIVTPKRVLELSCSKCKAAIHIQLFLPEEIKPHNLRGVSSGGDPTRLTLQVAETEEDYGTLSLKSKILRSLVELPPMPNIILKAREIIEDSGSSLKDLAAVIEHDQAIVARVLALANSAYYGLSGLVSSIQHASILLGQKTLGELITIAASSQFLSKKLQGYQLNPGALWKHSLAVALGSRIIAEKKNSEWAEDAFIAGLLHDAGKIILDPYIVERKKAFNKILKNGHPNFFEAEKQVLGFDHCEVMSRAARFWRYPEAQSAAIRYHHYPSRVGNSELAFIVHLADYTAKEAGFKSGNHHVSQPEIDPQALSYLGFQKQDLSHIIADISTSVEKLVTEFQ
jgi:HD-like signal output (HDOD) protein